MMARFFRPQSLTDLEAKLEAIDAGIAAHPLASENVKKAHRIVETCGHRSDDEIAQVLAARRLPTLEELGKIQLEHTGSWLRLHRSRDEVMRKIEELKR